MTEHIDIWFDIVGRPAAQAGMRTVPTARGVRAITTGSVHLADWRAACATEARAQAALHGTVSSPVQLVTTFRVPLPRARYRQALDHGGTLWRWRAATPDLDKLQRALGDGLTAGGLIEDDRLIVSWHAMKVETTGWCGTSVWLTTDIDTQRLVL